MIRHETAPIFCSRGKQFRIKIRYSVKTAENAPPFVKGYTTLSRKNKNRKATMSKRENEVKDATEKAEKIKKSLAVDETKRVIRKGLADKIEELVSEEEFDTV